MRRDTTQLNDRKQRHTEIQRDSMYALIGASIIVASVMLFWRMLPRDGKVHRVVGTFWEPYLVITFVGGAVVGLGFITVWAAQTWL